MTHRLWTGLGTAVLLAACGAGATTPTPQPLPVVTLTLEPAVARLKMEDGSTLLCISVIADPNELYVTPGSYHTICRTGRAWVTLIEAHQ